LKTELIVLGAGPAGYTAAFRAADLGKKVTLVERFPVLGGVCLNVGCIPSKTLLHVAMVLNEAKELTPAGINFLAPDINLEQLRDWKNKISVQLNTGLGALAKQRNITVINGTGLFVSDSQIQVDSQLILVWKWQLFITHWAVKLPLLKCRSKLFPVVTKTWSGRS
jgi:dihydrolipoamide dehydrogenase